MTNLGAIFHFGLYSLLGYDDIKSLRRRSMKNGSEWILKRLIENGSYRPLAGWKDSQLYIKTKYNVEDDFIKFYFDLIEEFDNNYKKIKKNMKEWINICKSAGMSYVIITTKHHDGFCLWPSEYSKYKSKKDLLSKFIKYARKENIKVGFYFSWMEFLEKSNIDFIEKVIKKQMDELIKYNVDYFWFDGDWSFISKYSNNEFSKICNKIHAKNPNTKINDRLGAHKDTKKLYSDRNYLGQSDYRNYGDREVPKDIPTVDWECIITIGLSWGYCASQTDKDYKSGEELYILYDEIKCKNGNMLINFGPDQEGKLVSNEVESLEKFIKLKNILE